MKIIKALLCVIFASFLFVIASCTDNNTTKDEKIVISATVEQRAKLTGLVNKFNEENPEHEATFEVLDDEDIKNYMLRHNALQGDIIAFENYYEANSYGDEFLSRLTINNVVGLYQSSIINYLKDNHGELYVLPSLGRFYSNFYNNDLLDRFAYSLPNNLTELFNLSNRVGTKVNNKDIVKGVSTNGGDGTILHSLIQVAYPEFLSTPLGNDFLTHYSLGEVVLDDDAYSEYFKTIFNDLKKLYFSKFISLSDVNNTTEVGINEFRNNETLILQTSIKNSYAEMLDEMENVTMYPFVGKSDGENFLASKPEFYLTVKKNVSEAKYVGLEKFFDFFASIEGQKLLVHESANDFKNLHEIKNGHLYVSYVKNFFFDLDESDEYMLEPIKQGRVFLIDTFIKIFTPSIKDIVSFIQNEIDVNTLLKTIDENMKKTYFDKEEEKKIEIIGEFNFNRQLIPLKETRGGNYIADALRRYFDYNTVIIDNDVFNADIYQDGFNYDDIRLILKNKNLYYAKATVGEIKKAILSYLQSKQIPLISGIRINIKNGNVEVYNQSNVILSDNEVLTIMVDEKLLGKITTISFSDKNDNIIDIFKKLLKNQTNVSTGTLDNRYGNIDFS